MRIFFVISLLFVSINIITSAKWKCNKSDERKVDELMAKIMTYGNSGRKYPSNTEEMKTYCQENYRMISDLEDYKNKCLDSNSKQSVGVILFSMKNLIKQYCKKNSRKVTELLSATNCANKASQEFNKCNTNYIDALLVAQNIPDKDKVPVLCCEYHKIFDCLHKRGKQVDGCTEEVLDICENYIKSHFDNVLKLLCGEYSENTDKCESVPKLPKKKRNQRRTKSFILPLVNLLKGI